MSWSCCSYLAAETLPWAPCSPPAPCAWTAAPPPSVSSSSASWSLLSSCLRLWRAAGTSPGPDQRGTWQQSHSGPGNVHIISIIYNYWLSLYLRIREPRAKSCILSSVSKVGNDGKGWDGCQGHCGLHVCMSPPPWHHHPALLPWLSWLLVQVRVPKYGSYGC